MYRTCTRSSDHLLIHSSSSSRLLSSHEHDVGSVGAEDRDHHWWNKRNVASPTIFLSHPLFYRYSVTAWHRSFCSNTLVTPIIKYDSAFFLWEPSWDSDNCVFFPNSLLSVSEYATTIAVFLFVGGMIQCRIECEGTETIESSLSVSCQQDMKWRRSLRREKRTKHRWQNRRKDSRTTVEQSERIWIMTKLIFTYSEDNRLNLSLTLPCTFRPKTTKVVATAMNICVVWRVVIVIEIHRGRRNPAEMNHSNMFLYGNKI